MIGCRQYTVLQRPYEEEKVKEVRKKDKEERFNMNSEESTSNNVLGTKVYISVMTTCSSLRCIFGCMNRIKGKLKLDGLTAPVKFCVEKIGRY